MMTRTPDEIKKGLECCVNDMEPGDECEGCPYFEKPSRFHWICRDDKVWSDALALIQQLEAQNAELSGKIGQLQAERDAAMKDLETVCNMMNICCMCKDDGEGSERCEGCLMSSNWQWRGVPKEE